MIFFQQLHFPLQFLLFKIIEPPLQGRKKKFFKIWHVGTPNLCLKVPEQMQKTRDESDYSMLRKCPKTTEKRQNMNLANFWQFLDVFSVWADRISF